MTGVIRVLATSVLLLFGASGAFATGNPLPYRIVSFHQGRANKALIKRAAELGFNGVMIQLEGANVPKLEEFAKRDAAEHYVDYSHSLGMKVTLWVHELADLPKPDSPGYLGEISVANEKLWQHIADRYGNVLGKLVPNVDGLVLTVVETQFNATDSGVMLKLAGIIRDECRKYGKELIVRTFVWHPKELDGVMGCVKQLPEDVVIMSKCVPQDWQMRGIHSMEIGKVGSRQQIVEYDIAGEYFLRNDVANCFPDLIKTQFDYGLANGVDGICVRVDRGNADVLHQPQEVNLWALGMLASGKTESVDEVWNAWATARYGAKAAPAVIRALKPTGEVVAEMLSIDRFTFGDTRGFPENGDRNVFHKNWQIWRWDQSFVPDYERGMTGDPGFTWRVEQQKKRGARLAARCLADLELARKDLALADYEILKTRLRSNQVQLEFRAPMVTAYLRYQRILKTQDQAEKQRLAGEIRRDLAAIRSVADRIYLPPRQIEHLGLKWKVGPPTGTEWKRLTRIIHHKLERDTLCF